jgi:hypothetical protein
LNPKLKGLTSSYFKKFDHLTLPEAGEKDDAGHTNHPTLPLDFAEDFQGINVYTTLLEYNPTKCDSFAFNELC